MSLRTGIAVGTVLLALVAVSARRTVAARAPNPTFPCPSVGT
ncbi:hypothetical protein [Mycobacterium sp. Lab-001]